MTRYLIAFTVLCVVFGTTFGAIRVGLEAGWPPFLSAGLRFTLGGAIVLAVAALRGELRRVERADLLGIVLAGTCLTAITFGTLYRAEEILPSGVAALIAAASPLFAVAYAVVRRTRRLDLVSLAGIAVATAGVALVAGVGRGEQGNLALIASIALIASEVAYAAGLIMSRALARRLPMLLVAGGQMLAGGLILLGLSAGFERSSALHVDASGLLALVYLTVVATAVAHTLSIWLAAATSATFAASWTYVSPFIALLVGAVWLHEPLGLTAWAGGVCVVAGCIALNRDIAPKAAHV